MCRWDCCNSCAIPRILENVPDDATVLKNVSQSALVQAGRKLARRWEKMQTMVAAEMDFFCAERGGDGSLFGRAGVATTFVEQGGSVGALATFVSRTTWSRSEGQQSTSAKVDDVFPLVFEKVATIVADSTRYLEYDLWGRVAREKIPAICDSGDLKDLIAATGSDTRHRLPSSKPLLRQLLLKGVDPYRDPADEQEENAEIDVPVFFPRFQGPLDTPKNVNKHIECLTAAYERRQEAPRDVFGVLCDVERAVSSAWFAREKIEAEQEVAEKIRKKAERKERRRKQREADRALGLEVVSSGDEESDSEEESESEEAGVDYAAQGLADLTGGKEDQQSQKKEGNKGGRGGKKGVIGTGARGTGNKKDANENLELNEKALDIDNELAELLLILMRKYTELGTLVYSLDNKNVCEKPPNERLNGLEKHDVRGKGSIVLTSFAIVGLLDRWACHEWPLLKQHSLGTKVWGLQFRSSEEDEDLLEQIEQDSKNRPTPGIPYVPGILSPFGPPSSRGHTLDPRREPTGETVSHFFCPQLGLGWVVQIIQGKIFKRDDDRGCAIDLFSGL